MVSAMTPSKTASKFLQKSVYLLSAVFIVACQPPAPTDEALSAANSANAELPVVITDDSVIMAPEHILSIKPSRYQPSLGLQGTIEPIKKAKFIAAYPINVEEILVTKGQWVKKGTPLFIVSRLNNSSQNPETSTANELTAESEQSILENQNIDNINSSKQQDGAKDTVKDATKTDISAKSNQSALDDKTAENQPQTDDKVQTDNKTLTTTSTPDDSVERADSFADGAKKPKPQYNLITQYAAFSGRIESLYAATGQNLAARSPILQLSDKTKLHFVATLPIQAKPQLSVGQTVNFSAEGLIDKFTGQVSKLTITTEPKTLLVYVNAVDNELSRKNLLPGMKVTGRVDYGQIEVGTIVPKQALHNVDLTELQSPPYKPLKSLTANVWIIGQDQRLTLQPIEVVEFDPATNQYLIAGISNDSLICLADLPIDSKGKKVIVS